MTGSTRKLAAVLATLLAMVMVPGTWAQVSGAGSAGPSVLMEGVWESSGARPGETVRLAAAVTVEEGWHVNAHKPSDPYIIPTTLDLSLPEGVTAGRTAYPEPTLFEVQGFPEKLAVYGGKFVIGVEVHVGAEVKPGTFNVPMTLHYQACNDRQCMMPTQTPALAELAVVEPGAAVTPQRLDLFEGLVFSEEAGAQTPPETPATEAPADTGDWRALIGGFEVAGTAGGYLSASEFLAFLDRVEKGEAEAGLFENKSVWLVVVLVIVGGILLNLTPCVLPLIPINLAIIGAGAKAGSRRRGFLLGGTYGLGMAATYGLLGLVVVLGLSSTFGALNSTIWFNAVIAAVFVALALAMFDVFILDFSRLQGRLGVARLQGGTFVAAGVMGAVAALLAGACVAPVIISTIVYAQDQYARGNRVALLLPFLIGLGMGLPWPFAGAGLSFLPKPGKWMERVKYVFGAVILVAAGYFAYQTWLLFSNKYLVDRQAVQASAAALDKEGWHSDLATALDEARRDGKPVLIDFWATWCKNCLWMNETTFRDPAVKARLEKYVKVKYQAERLSEPATRAVMERFDVIGLPTYVVLKPRPG
ncbi:MAG TPA: thioredoxin family protein [Candidatus Bathyarchaeia archaeon]|nr:thioredoxin family protein [Candidatus Bathyarchaeia archaeon]